MANDVIRGTCDYCKKPIYVKKYDMIGDKKYHERCWYRALAKKVHLNEEGQYNGRKSIR